MEHVGLYLPFILMFVFMAMGMPIAFAVGISGALGIYLVSGGSALMGVLQSTPYHEVSKYLLVSLPLFVFFAEVISQTSLVNKIFDAARVWTRRIPGGMVISTVLASAGLGSITGSSTGTAAFVSKAAIPEMRRLGYDIRISLGTVSSAGAIAILLPPSLALIMYGIIANQSISNLFLAAIVPAIIQVILYISLIIWKAKKKPELFAPMEEVTKGEGWKHFINLLPILLVITLIFTSIYTGMLTIVESAAFGAILIIAISFFNGLTIRKLGKAAIETVQIASMLFFNLIGAIIFGYYITMTQVTQKLVNLISSMDANRFVILALILLVFFVLGFFMEQVIILVVAVPLVYPLIESLGFDLIWFGIVATVMAEIGMIHPPLGLNVFVATSVSGTKIEDGFAGVWGYVGACLVLIALLIIFPNIAIWLPSNL